ncbi:uncharacterized protein LOC144925510 isoform X2 [Branchiostoma floridae x Branchiostoma belcheri]
MAIGIPRVENCCCCCSLKCGIIALSVVFMVFTLMNLVVSIFIVGRVGVTNPSIEDEGDPVADLMIGDLVVDVLMIILCVSLVVAAIKNRPETAHQLGHLWAVFAFEGGLLIYGVILVNSFAERLRETEGSLPPYGQVREPSRSI